MDARKAAAAAAAAAAAREAAAAHVAPTTGMYSAAARAELEDLFSHANESEGGGASISGLEGASSIDHLLGVGGGLEDADLDDLEDHELIRGIREQGRVLQEYSRDIDARLAQAELDTVAEYIQEADGMVALHDQIRNADGILSNMESLLTRFQGDLGRVSGEIRQLQVQSQTMRTKLKNRRGAEAQLGSFVENMVMPEHMVIGILEADVNEAYLTYLQELDKKLRFVSVHSDCQSTKDLEPALRKLSIKASSRVRDFLLTKICLLKRPKTNVQIVQQSSLLKYKYFMHFLREHSQEVYGEIRAEYMSVMSRILAAHFRMYLVSMEKLQTAVACESDVIGVIHTDSSTVSKISGLFQKATRDTTPERVFELGERVGVLADPDEPAVIPHVAENAGAKLPYEVIFRSVHKLLMDTATSEHFFCVDFFADGPAFKELLVPVVAVVEAALAQAMTTNWDMVGCLLMIRVNHSQRGVMSRRRVPCLDDYLDRVQLLLWPRFKVLFDLQLSSLKSASDRHLASDSPDVHIVVRRYAALAASMLFLMAEYDSDDTALFKAQTFYDMMDRLWAAIFDLLLRMSNLFKDRRSGIIFLTVNYAHIVSTLRTADTSASPSLPSGPGSAASAAASSSVPGGRGGIGGGGGAAGKARSGGEAAGAGGGGRGTGIGKTGASAIKECEDQFQTCMGLYVEDQMARRFQFMVDFVKKAEQQQKRGSVPEGQPIPSFGPAQAGPILRDFASRWKGAVEAMHREASTDFARSPCERDVLQASMTALLKYYTRMLELVKHQGPEGAAMARDAVNVPSIMYEIKRISKS